MGCSNSNNYRVGEWKVMMFFYRVKIYKTMKKNIKNTNKKNNQACITNTCLI